jgi:hypothetical protein
VSKYAKSTKNSNLQIPKYRCSLHYKSYVHNLFSEKSISEVPVISLRRFSPCLWGPNRKKSAAKCVAVLRKIPGLNGAKLWKRFVAATICGIALGLLYTVVSALLVKKMPIGDIAAGCVWSVFVFAIVSTIGAIITELRLPEPKNENTV